MGRHKTKHLKTVTVDGETHTILEWSEINQISITRIDSRIKRVAAGDTELTPAQIVGSEDMPEPKHVGRKPETYKSRSNKKSDFKGNKLALDMARRCLV